MSLIDQTKEGDVEVQDLVEFPNQQQAEMIADQYAKISNQYKPLKSEDLDCSNMTDSKPLPLFDPYQVYLKIKKMKKKSSTILNDVPWKVIYEYSVELTKIFSKILKALLSDSIIGDTLHPSKYGNEKGLSALHYTRNSGHQQCHSQKCSHSTAY